MPAVFSWSPAAQTFVLVILHWLCKTMAPLSLLQVCFCVRWCRSDRCLACSDLADGERTKFAFDVAFLSLTAETDHGLVANHLSLLRSDSPQTKVKCFFRLGLETDRFCCRSYCWSKIRALHLRVQAESFSSRSVLDFLNVFSCCKCGFSSGRSHLGLD